MRHILDRFTRLGDLLISLVGIIAIEKREARARAGEYLEKISACLINIANYETKDNSLRFYCSELKGYVADISEALEGVLPEDKVNNIALLLTTSVTARTIHFSAQNEFYREEFREHLMSVAGRLLAFANTIRTK